MFGLLKAGKDAALSAGAKMAINNHIKEYGEMLKLNLDSSNKSMEMEVMLEGEKEPLTVNVQKYEMTQEGEKHFLTIQGVKTSRAWINTMASSYLEGKKFEIPAEYAKMLQVVV